MTIVDFNEVERQRRRRNSSNQSCASLDCGDFASDPFESGKRFFFSVFYLAVVLLAGMSWGQRNALAWQTPLVAPPPTNSSVPNSAATADDSRVLNTLLTEWVLSEIPHQYTDQRKWGMQEQVYAGFKFRRDGKRLETERVWKTVNHGQWQKYAVALRNPQQEFSVAITDVRPGASDATVVVLEFVTPLTLSARQSQWQRGVQLYSLSVEGWAQVSLQVECELKLRVERSREGANRESRLVIDPRVRQANLTLHEFRIDRISKVGGEVAQQLGRWAEKELQQELRQRSEELVSRINQQIDRHRERLHLPLREVISGSWAEFLAQPLPSDWRKWLPQESTID